MKRHQAMIREADLPDVVERHNLAELAAAFLVDNGYARIGIDHFARPHDALAVAAREGRLRRNFQGYTVDRADALIGLGASSIGGCRKAMSRTRQLSPTIRGGSPAAGSP